MTNKSKLALIAVVAATLGIASPAFAQSYNPGDGTGNALPFAYGPGGTKQRSVVVAAGDRAACRSPERAERPRHGSA